MERARNLQRAPAWPLAGMQDICERGLTEEPAHNHPQRPAAELYKEQFENGGLRAFEPAAFA